LSIMEVATVVHSERDPNPNARCRVNLESLEEWRTYA